MNSDDFSAEASAAEPVLAYRQKRHVKLGGSGCAALVCFLAGVLLLFTVVLWPLGLAMIALAFVVDVKKGYVTFCGSCGNDVPPTANLCPTCRAELIAMPKRVVPWQVVMLFLMGCVGLLIFVSVMRWRYEQEEARKNAPAEVQQPGS